LIIHYNTASFNPKKPVILTPGTFDGVHFGHQKILKILTDTAKEKNMESVVLTFSPHPRKVLFPDGKPLFLINTLDEKIEQLKKHGVDHLIIYPFTLDFSRISALEYVRDFLLNELKVSKLVIGYDHQFGRNREGDFNYLKELSPLYEFEIEEISAQDINEVNISSTKIRKAILNGDIETANEYLGYQFSITGDVVEGKKLGNTIGFPTANIQPTSNDKIIPKNGAYAVSVTVDSKQYGGMLNIGHNPTVSSDQTQHIEVNIFDFNQNIYGTDITVYFIKRLRDEKKFESVDELKQQLADDALLAKQFV